MKQELFSFRPRKRDGRKGKILFSAAYSLRNQKNDFDDKKPSQSGEGRENKEAFYEALKHKLHNLIFVFSYRRIFEILPSCDTNVYQL